MKALRGPYFQGRTTPEQGRSRRLAAYFPFELVDAWHCHICLSLCQTMSGASLETTLSAPAARRSARRAFTRVGVPPLLAPLAYRIDRYLPVVERAAQLRYGIELNRADAAYLWAAVPMAMYAQVERAGLPLFVERINCHRRTTKRILDEVYARAGLPASHGITDAASTEESEKLSRADYVFAPSPHVRDSLLEAGIPAAKVLSTSYGFDPARVPLGARPEHQREPVFLFLGTLCLRKGAHLLLQAWSRAGSPGRLILCGRLAPELAALGRRQLELRGVEHRGFVTDIRPVLREADVLILPTFEEGSPLVVYEAMAAGLVPLVTPMGAGELVRPEIDGRIVQPHDIDGLAQGIVELATHSALRARFSASSAARALDYTWDRVGVRRRALVLEALRGDAASSSPRALERTVTAPS